MAMAAGFEPHHGKHVFGYSGYTEMGWSCSTMKLKMGMIPELQGRVETRNRTPRRFSRKGMEKPWTSKWIHVHVKLPWIQSDDMAWSIRDSLRDEATSASIAVEHACNWLTMCFCLSQKASNKAIESSNWCCSRHDFGIRRRLEYPMPLDTSSCLGNAT